MIHRKLTVLAVSAFAVLSTLPAAANAMSTTDPTPSQPSAAQVPPFFTATPRCGSVESSYVEHRAVPSGCTTGMQQVRLYDSAGSTWGYCMTASMAATSRSSSGSTRGEKRAMTFPEPSTRYFSKFHWTSPVSPFSSVASVSVR